MDCPERGGRVKTMHRGDPFLALQLSVFSLMSQVSGADRTRPFLLFQRCLFAGRLTPYTVILSIWAYAASLHGVNRSLPIRSSSDDSIVGSSFHRRGATIYAVYLLTPGDSLLARAWS